MEKISKKRVVILIFLTLLIIFGLIAFRNSTAQQIIAINANIIDYNGLIKDETCIINAIDEGESGYYIILPDSINNKIVNKYIIEKKQIENSTNVDINQTSANMQIENNTQNISETMVQETTQQIDSNIIEKLPKDKIYLTKEELEIKEISLTVEYDSKQKDTQMLYKQILEKTVGEEESNQKKVIITGYMPIDANISIKEIEEEEIANSIDNYINDKVSMQIAYDIKIIYNEQEYEPSDFDENVKVTITGVNNNVNKQNKYKVIHIKENEVEEINNINIDNNEISFHTNEFSTYVVLLEEGSVEQITPLSIVYSQSTNTWDGSTATSFAFGTGTSSDPYLISTGAELAYLGEQVTSGTTYANSYFQVTNDIDLNGNAWTPIGTYSSSFRGIFDGAGHTIANATITISSLATATTGVVSYGFFSSVGGGTTYATIKNVEFENIDITITASGTTDNNSNAKGYNIGIVAGTLFRDASIINVITNSCNITDTATITLRNSYQFFVGGIAGCAVNSTSSTTDPGAGNRYIIENCFSSTYIDLDVVLRSSSMVNAGQYHAGGAIGMIRSQPVWPSNCLYTGNIDATNGFTGPIFGALRNNTAYTSTSNFATLWNGNDAGGSLTTDSYYSAYSTNSYVPTTSVTTGTSTVRRSSSTTNIGSVQGVNKGIYTSTLSSRLTSFNTYAGSNYATWQFQNNTYSFLKHLTAYMVDNNPSYNIVVEDDYSRTYTYKWYINGTLDSNLQSDTETIQSSFDDDKDIRVIISDGTYFTVVSFTIPQLTLYVSFDIDTQNNSVTASLAGTAVPDYINYNDYTYTWYIEDITGLESTQVGNTLTLTGLEEGKDYRLVATNNQNSSLTREGSFTYGNRIVIYVNYSSGVDTNDGFTPATAVKTMSTAYTKINASYSSVENIIVVIGNYTDNTYLNSASATTYNKQATLTGYYKGTNYNARLTFSGSKYLTNDTIMQYMTLYGGSASVMFYAQGYDLTMGKQIIMNSYPAIGSDYGQITGVTTPDFHLIGAFLNYNLSSIPAANNNSTITIKSGTYGRIIAGCRSDADGANISHNIFGTSTNPFNVNVIINIEQSTTDPQYAYDINLLVGGQTDGSIYANVGLDISAGGIGRVLGGSIGNTRTYSGYPANSFFGSSTITVSGGTIQEIFGTSLGRNKNDIYYYGDVEINVSGGTINSNIYGAGAGGVTGYNSASTDPYKSYGQSYSTDININISGGTINGNIYGAGYGYSPYLTATTIATDGGALYGNSYINITGGAISGNIYGAGRGYSGYSGKTALAQMIGNTSLIISGTPNITGNIYGAAEGISGYQDTAKLTGNTTININISLSINIYGGSNVAQMVGDTTVNINNGVQTGTIYGGGNLGLVSGTTNVYINQSTAINVYGGGQSSDATNTKVYIQGGQVTNIYGGSNVTGTVSTATITGTSGTVNTIYGGNNTGGTTDTVNITINGASVTNAVFGGGNQANTTTATVTLTSLGNTIPEVYGGGNAASVSNTYIYCNGGNISSIYGGSNTSGTVTTSNVNINGGNISNIYGGNNAGGITTTANVTSTAGTVTTAIYGGGKQANTQTSYINLNGLTNTIPAVYGGGQSADVSISNVNMKGANATDVFGGSNTSGTVTTSNVSITNGTIANVYGGNNSGGTTITTNITSTAGNITNSICGGGKQANTQTSYINLNGLTNTVPAVYGGGQSADVNISNVNMKGASATNVFGGSNTSGTVTTSYVSTTGGTITNVYGGNNIGGTTGTTNVTIEGGSISNVYGGGNQAIANTTNVDIKAAVTNSVYGGGNAAGILTNTNLNLIGATVGDNVYGGGNEGTVNGNTNVRVKNSVLQNSLYSGGNGVTAIVVGNTNLIMEGTTNEIINSVFGGGNQAATGTSTSENSVSTVNIVGGIIGGNVYGGANTSVVHGVAQINIGYDTVGNSSLQMGNIEIEGTVFGGGEANASGSEIYDFSFISVTNGIDININGNGHTRFIIEGSIFGSGNASSTSGASHIYIKNYGTASNPEKNVSIQRATNLVVDNSAITLAGAKDRTNEYSNVYFSLSRIDELKLKNNSTLYLNYGSNLLKKFSSLVDQGSIEVKAIATVNEQTGEVTKNVDNRLYMLEGRNLNIATNEQVTAYGEVYGMTFFGIYTNAMNPSTSTGLYNYNYENGDYITNAGTFSTNSYVMGQHKANHDITQDGFYSNYDNEGYVKCSYIPTIPAEDVYYVWTIGEETDVTLFELSLTASKYATLGTYELLLTGFSTPNTRLSLVGFSSGLESNITLVDPIEIDAIAPTPEEADSIFGLSMKTGNNGWQSRNVTTFLTAEGGTYTGSNMYYGANSTYTPTLIFCFYHSENLTLQQSLGNVTIRFQAMIPIDDLTYSISYIDIRITLATALYQDDYYEAAITPGEEFGLFTTTETNITDSSIFSTYYSLFIPNFSSTDYYESYNTHKHVLISRDALNNAYIFPLNTKITMLDMATNKYYYYVMSAADVLANKYVFYLSDFISMGSTNEQYDEVNAYNNYYNSSQDLIYENFIFHIDFSGNTIPTDIVDNTLLMELRDSGNQTLIGVLGIQRNTMLYSVYKNKNATIDVTAETNQPSIYLGNKFNLTATTNFIQNIIASKTIYDTKYFNQKMGVKITIYDNNNNKLSLDSLLGVTFKLNGIKYYPRVDGSARIKVADLVSNVLSRIEVDTSNNTTLATGDYTIKVESFGSSDGIYYGKTSSDTTQVPITIINSSYGLKVSSDDQSKIVDKDTGETLNGNNSLVTTIDYSSGLNNPNIAMLLYRRDYSGIYSQSYNLVDLADYVTTTLVPTARSKEYVAITGIPAAHNVHFLLLNENLITGTYRLVFKLYDGNNYIGEAYEYFIVK